MDETGGIEQLPVNAYTLTAFIGYILLIFAIGVYSSRFSSQGISEYFIGKRTMNRFVVALSAVVSGRSAWLLVGFTGMAYKNGAAAMWAAVGYVIVELLLFLYYAPRLRDFAGEHDCITLPDFYAARFNDRNGYLRMLLVLVMIVFMVSYVSAQLLAGGKAFASSFELERAWGVSITALIVLGYTILGGFLAVSLTDVLQACFMIVALIALPVIAVLDSGGWQAVAGELRSMEVTMLDPMALTFGGFLGFVGIGLGSPGNPHILTRYMSINDSKQLKVSAVVGTVWNVLMAAGAVFVGLAGRYYFPETSALPNEDVENLFPALAETHLHPILFGLVIASIFAAIMSTADSMLLVAASSVVRDVYERIFRKGEVIPQQKLVFMSRAVVTLLVAVALVLGWLAQELVFWLVLFAWAGLGAAIGPTSILALFWRGTRWEGVFAGIITGTITVFVWKNVPVLEETVYELIPAFVLSTLVTVVVSLVVGKGKDEKE